MYKIVRNPIERFYSWYNVYVNTQDINHIFIKNYLTPNNLDEWFEYFKIIMHYDEHSALQKYLHRFDARFNDCKTKYILSKHLKNIIHNSYDEYQEKEYNKLCNGLEDKYLIALYNDDIEWIKSLGV